MISRKSTFIISTTIAVLMLICLTLGRVNPSVKVTRATLVINATGANLQSESLSDAALFDDARGFASTPEKLDQPQFAPSLKGTDIDGKLRVGSDGNLLVELATRDFFDYFLATSSEVGPEAAISEVLRYIDTYLTEPALQQARALFAKYLRYKKFNSELKRTPIAKGIDAKGYLELLQNTYTKQKTARLDIFSPQENNALFGVEERYAQYTLENMSIENNPDLSDEQRASLLANNRATLPAAVQATLARQEITTTTNNQITELLNSKLDDSQVYSELKEKGYDDNKAGQMLAYRQQQKSFNARYKKYQKHKANLQTQNLPKEKMRAQLNELRAKLFMSEQEQTQVKLKDLE